MEDSIHLIVALKLFTLTIHHRFQGAKNDIWRMQGLIAMLAAVDALSHVEGLDELKKQVSLLLFIYLFIYLFYFFVNTLWCMHVGNCERFTFDFTPLSFYAINCFTLDKTKLFHCITILSNQIPTSVYLKDMIPEYCLLRRIHIFKKIIKKKGKFHQL